VVFVSVIRWTRSWICSVVRRAALATASVLPKRYLAREIYEIITSPPESESSAA
jgi:hypothetical protein